MQIFDLIEEDSLQTIPAADESTRATTHSADHDSQGTPSPSLDDDIGVNFGLLDSLTLASRNFPTKQATTFATATTSTTSTNDDANEEEEDWLNDIDMTQQDKDDIKSSWKEFESSWSSVMEINNANPNTTTSILPSVTSPRRSGVRRGDSLPHGNQVQQEKKQQQQEKQEEEGISSSKMVYTVPTKLNDGPSINTNGLFGRVRAKRSRGARAA